jgi:hypothetical protein
MRRLVTFGLLLAMAAFGWAVYTTLGAHRSRTVSVHAQAPSQTKPKISLPGTVVVAQAGSLYRLRDGVFSEIATGGWTQPAIDPSHTQLVAVKRTVTTSDLYLLGTDGHVIRQLTQNGSRVTQLNHWSFYPRISLDGQTVFYSWDAKDLNNSYRVDLSIYAQPLARGQAQARRWTTPNFYTGGDVEPVPAPTGGLVYAKYDLNDAGQIFSQIWLTPRLGAPGKALTQPADDCSQPALSPDGAQIAMICASGQATRMMVADFNGAALGPPRVVLTGLAADPTWSPDGRSLVYFSPLIPSGHFQLYVQTVPPAPQATAAPAAGAVQRTPASTSTPVPAPSPTAPATPPPPVQVTTDNDFDTTAAPVWF